MVKKKKKMCKRTVKNLRYSMKDEAGAVREYPHFAKVARAEHCPTVAKFFASAAKDERRHHKRCVQLLRMCTKKC